MENQVYSNYFKGVLKNSKSAKKQVALYLDDETLERIDTIIKLFSSISDSKGFTRNKLMEDALDKYMEESEKFLLNEYGIDVNNLFDTVILSSGGRRFEDIFLGEAEDMCWYPCKINEGREANLKYIAIYREQPVSAITHYAAVKEFKYSSDRGCKVCYFRGRPVKLSNEITLGSKDNTFFSAAKYTKLENLLNVNIVDDIKFI